MTGKRPSNNQGRPSSGGSGAGRKPAAPKARSPKPAASPRPAARLPGIGDRADKAYRTDKNGQSSSTKRAGQTRGPRRGAGLPAQQAAIREGTLGRPGPMARGRDAGPPADWFEAPVPKTRKRAPKAAAVEVEVVPVVEVPPEVPVQPQRNVSRREAKAVRLDGKSEWTRKFVQALKSHGKGAADLLVVDPSDVDELSDDDIFRTLMLELYITRKKKDESVDTRPLQDALYNFEVRSVCDNRDEAAARLLALVGDRKKVHAMLQNVLRFVSIQERFRSFRNYLVEKVDRFENLEFDLEHRFVGLKPQQIQSLIDALGLSRRMASREPTLKVLHEWGAVPDATLTPDNWAKARSVLRTVQGEVGCAMGALEQMFMTFANAAPVKSSR